MSIVLSILSPVLIFDLHTSYWPKLRLLRLEKAVIIVPLRRNSCYAAYPRAYLSTAHTRFTLCIFIQEYWYGKASLTTHACTGTSSQRVNISASKERVLLTLTLHKPWIIDLWVTNADVPPHSTVPKLLFPFDYSRDLKGEWRCQDRVPKHQPTRLGRHMAQAIIPDRDF